MKKTAFILAVIAAAIAALFTAPAYAGGKRLQFGGPLGSFEATPYAKGTSHRRRSYSKKRSSHAAKKAHTRKLAAKRAAAKKAHARKLAAKKAHARKLAAKKAAAKKAHARKLAAKKAATKKVTARKAAAAKKRKLANSRKAEEKVIETAATSEETNKVAPVKASAIAGTNTLDFDRKEDDQANKVEIEPAYADVEDTQGEIRESKAELECKKYIPSAGLTISVACGS